MFPERVSSLKVSGIRKLFEAAPPGSINLGLGEPDIQPPNEMIKAFCDALHKGYNKYGPSAGIKELREAIAAYLRQYRRDVSYENIIVTAGATEGMRIACETILGDGDEALVPNPGFIIYGPDVRLAGAKPVEYSLLQRNGYLPDIEEIKSLITPRTKAIIVNSPSNPLGTVFPKETVKALSELAKDNKLYILSDEVYDNYVYEGEHLSFARFHNDTIIVQSFSKSLAATGWRIGYVATSKEIVQQLSKVQYYTLACPPTATQYGVLEGLKILDRFQETVLQEFRMRREIAMEKLSEIPSFTTAPVNGAFYVFPRFSQKISSEKFALKILDRGVICAPGSSFGSHGEGHMRFSYANSRDNIAKGLEVVKDVAAQL
ncbi:MAG: pyridoxal phosphate-dependent aminotransferase [Thermoplasmatota archaeon]|nr:pyridoxal phosphate-dependent aminotransferase [Candidatus Thermoplasmatota archaeon]MBU1914809.1 pyridoxal phosphate-dependent aminotransferase [Candidatus Thermoplasmatota archaeon]